jgi:hypothetical protein
MKDERIFKPAAAWSRDSLAAWQFMADETTPRPGRATCPEHCHTEFLRRWAIKILCLVNNEMPHSDWYWFLSHHFDKELLRLDPYVKPLREAMFVGGDFDNDPKSEAKP